MAWASTMPKLCSTLKKATSVRPYIISLVVGLLVGIIYAGLRVKSPAPPAIALVGLLGMLIGESVFPLIKDRLFPPAEPARIEKQELNRFK